MPRREFEKLIEDEMEAFFIEEKLSEDRREAFRFHKTRFVCSMYWLKELELDGKNVLELGSPFLSTRLIKACFPNIMLRNTDFELRKNFPYEDESFDVVISMEVIEHVFDLELKQTTTLTLSGVKHVISECYRVLKPDGKMFLTTPNACSTWIIQRTLRQEPPLFYPAHFREFTYFEIVNLIREAGFEIQKATTEKVWHFWDFRPIEEFMYRYGYSLDFRGDDTFVISCKSGV